MSEKKIDPNPVAVRALKGYFEKKRSVRKLVSHERNEELKGLEVEGVAKKKMNIWLERIVGNELEATAPKRRASTAVPKGASSPTNSEEEKKRRLAEEKRLEQVRIREEERRKLEEKQRMQEEEERIRKETEKKEREKKEEEERQRREEERKEREKKEEEDRARREEERKKEEARIEEENKARLAQLANEEEKKKEEEKQRKEAEERRKKEEEEKKLEEEKRQKEEQERERLRVEEENKRKEEEQKRVAEEQAIEAEKQKQREEERKRLEDEEIEAKKVALAREQAEQEEARAKLLQQAAEEAAALAAENAKKAEAEIAAAKAAADAEAAKKAEEAAAEAAAAKKAADEAAKKAAEETEAAAKAAEQARQAQEAQHLAAQEAAEKAAASNKTEAPTSFTIAVVNVEGKKQTIGETSTTTTIEEEKPKLSEKEEEERKAERKKKKDKCLEELLGSEKFYVRFLNILKQCFYEPLRADTDAKHPSKAGSKFHLSLEQVNHIFGNLEEIRTIHEAIYADLKAATNKEFAPAFLKQITFVSAYTTYMQNFDTTINIINAQKTNDKFLEFLKNKRQDEKTGGLNILSFLIMPIQRIPRYYNLFRDLRINSEEGVSEIKELKQCTDKYYNLYSVITDRRNRLENAAKILNVQNRIHGKYDPLLTEGRTYLREGEFEDDKGKIHLLFLFSDLVLWANHKYEYQGNLNMAHVIVSNYSDTKDAKVGFQVHHFDPANSSKPEKPKLVCICSKVKEKMDWMKKLSDAITSHKDRLIQQRARAHSNKDDMHRRISTQLMDLGRKVQEKGKEEKASLEVVESSNLAQMQIKRKSISAPVSPKS